MLLAWSCVPGTCREWSCPRSAPLRGALTTEKALRSFSSVRRWPLTVGPPTPGSHPQILQRSIIEKERYWTFSAVR